MTPMDFAKGFLSVLSTKGFDRMDKLDVHSESGRSALQAAFNVVDDTVGTFTGNAAKSPRYRDWLKLSSGCALKFCFILAKSTANYRKISSIGRRFKHSKTNRYAAAFLSKLNG